MYYIWESLRILSLFIIILISFIIVSSSVILLSIYRCFVISVLWNWFLPRLFNLPEINVIQSFVLVMILQLMLPTGHLKNDLVDESKTKFLEKYGKLISFYLSPAIALLIGWIVKNFFM